VELHHDANGEEKGQGSRRRVRAFIVVVKGAQALEHAACAARCTAANSMEEIDADRKLSIAV
jgi:hypothetical protein